MSKSFTANLLFILIINLIIKPLYVFGVEVEVQNTLGADQYGLFFALLNSAYLLQIVNDFGIQLFNNRQVSMDRKQLTGLLPGLLVIKLVFSLLYIVLLTLLGFALGYSGSIGLFLLIGINLILISFILFIRSGISGLGYYRIDSVLSVLDKFLMILIIGGMLIFLRHHGFSVYHFVFGQMAALLLTAVIAWSLLQRYGHLAFATIPLGRLWELVQKAFPYALVVFLMTLYTRSDGVMIKALLPNGDYEAGIYAAGYRILDAVNMVAFLFAVMLLPMFSRVQNVLPELQRLLDEGVRYMAILVLPVCLFGILFNDQIMALLYTQASAYWGRVFALLIATFATTGVMYVFGTLLTALGNLRAMNSVYAVTLALNILLNFLLIPRFHAGGAAIATVVTQVFAATGIVVLCFRAVRMALAPSLLFRLLGFGAGCFVIFWLTGKVLLPGRWVLGLPLMGVLVVILAFGFRLIRFAELRLLAGKR